MKTLNLQVTMIYNIEIMGNCLGSKTENKEIVHEIPQKNKALDPKIDAKLQDYLSIEDQDLMIDSYDINTTNHPAFIQISKDIDRTYPKEQFFKNAENKKIFERLLIRIALHYPKLGYTQGINFVAGYFLINGSTEIQSYKSFANMLVHPELMHFGLYQDQFPLVRLHCSLFWILFKKKCGKFAAKIDQIKLPDEMWIFQWFICFYIYSFPIQYIYKMFAFTLKEKGFAMVRIAVSIMMNLSTKFDSITDQFEQEFVQCIEYLKDYEYCKKNIPIDAVIATAEKIKPKQIQDLLNKDSENWYEKYFSSKPEARKIIYDGFLKGKEKDRKEYFGKIKSGISIEVYERNRDSVEVIDNIEQKKVQRYFNLLYHSVKQRPVHSFVRLEKRYSLRENRSDNRLDNRQDNRQDNRLNGALVQSIMIE